MRLRAVSLGLCVLLMSACALKGQKPAESAADSAATGGESTLAQAPVPVLTENEVINSVDAEPPPRAEPKPERERELAAPSLDPLSIEERLRAQDGDAAPARSSKAASKATPRPSLTPPEPKGPVAPMAGRVGVMNLIGNELKHVHSSTFGGHERAFNVQYDFGGYVMEELRKALLTKTPYQPVVVNSTGALRKAAHEWQGTWDGERFSDVYQREFDGIIKQNQLAMLIIVSYPPMKDGQFLSGTELIGSGMYTRSVLGGTKVAVFSSLQFYRLVGVPAKLVMPIAPADDRGLGDLPNVKLPDDLEELAPRYLVPVYEPLRTIVKNKIHGLVSLPRKLGH